MLEPYKSETGKIVLEIDIDTGNVIVSDGKNPAFEGVPLEKVTINGQALTKATPNHTMFFTHSSPGCVYYIYGGRAWRVCTKK